MLPVTKRTGALIHVFMYRVVGSKLAPPIIQIGYHVALAEFSKSS